MLYKKEIALNNIKETTLQNILDAAETEFLRKGFKSASLRNIVKSAGVTTGAFYGYFKNKEALFSALVKPYADIFLNKFNEAQITFSELPHDKQPDNMGKISGNCMMWMLDYMYEHPNAFKLLICCSEGTEYENFIHTLVEIETDYTHKFFDVLKSLGYNVKKSDSQLEHILVSAMFSGFFETVIHDMPKEKAIVYIRELREFYTAGWREIMGI